MRGPRSPREAGGKSAVPLPTLTSWRAPCPLLPPSSRRLGWTGSQFVQLAAGSLLAPAAQHKSPSKQSERQRKGKGRAGERKAAKGGHMPPALAATPRDGRWGPPGRSRGPMPAGWELHGCKFPAKSLPRVQRQTSNSTPLQPPPRTAFPPPPRSPRLPTPSPRGCSPSPRSGCPHPPHCHPWVGADS